MGFNEKMTTLADAIRGKTNQTKDLTLDEMATSVESIKAGVDTNDATASADEILQGETAYVAGGKVTGTFTIDNELTAQDNLITQIQSALQNKAAGSEPMLQEKTVTPTKSSQSVTPDSQYDGLSKVTVNAIPSDYIIPSGTKTITTNGTHDVKSCASATVNVAGEDVTTETNAYTTKLATLETAITALETELQGKAGGGSGGGGSIETCTVTISFQYGDPRDIWISGTQLINNSIQPFNFVDYSDYTHDSSLFASPYTISNIVKNTPITISGYGSYAISSDAVTGNGCELLYSSISAKTLAVNITEAEATITIRNDY